MRFVFDLDFGRAWKRFALWTYALLFCGQAVLFAPMAFAQDTNLPGAAGDVQTNLSDAANVGQQSIAGYLPEPLRSWNGLRPLWAKNGVTLALTYQSDPMASLSGGMKTGSTYFGRLQTTVEYDPEKTLGWRGAMFHVSGYQIHGKSLSQHFLGSVAFVSDLEAYATTRLYEAWYEQKLFNDSLAIRIGQMGADAEFFLSPYYGFAIGGAFGWPTIASMNLPSGGPAYPFGALGARVKYSATEKLTLMGAVFNGDPAGPSGPGKDDNAQIRNKNGVNFRLRDTPLFIGETQLAYGDPEKGPVLPGTLRIGGWAHFGRFNDKRFAADGSLIADPMGVGTPMQKRGNNGIYGVIDQQVYQSASKKTDGVYAFGRISHSPGDRNFIDFYVDGGLSFIGLVPDRSDDQFGFVATYAHVSPAVRLADYDTRWFNAPAMIPAHRFEAIVEATYICHVANGFNIQPNIQYVIHPGAGGADSSSPTSTKAQRNAIVVGARTTLQY